MEQSSDIHKSPSKENRKRTHSSTSDSSFKSPFNPPKKHSNVEQNMNNLDNGLSAKQRKELLDTEERLKMQ